VRSEFSKLLANSGITLACQGVRLVLQLASTAILSRLLRPKDFGLIATVAIVTNFIGIFKDLGLTAATVQSKRVTQGQISALFWINLAASLFLGLLVVGVSPLAALFFGEPKLQLIITVLAIPVVLSGAASQHQALLQRDLRFGAIGASEIAAQAIAVLAAVAAAVCGWGCWALVLMYIVNAAALLVLVILVSGWKPTWHLRRTGVRPMLRFGRDLTAFNIVNYFARNLDNLLIAKFVGETALGFYNRAYQLMLFPISQINQPIAKVLLPGLARLRDEPEKYETTYLAFVRLIAWLTMPGIALMIVIGDRVTVWLLGEQWYEAGRLFRVLAIAGLFQPLASLNGGVMLSLGQAGRNLRGGIVASVLISISFVVGVFFGAYGVAVAYAIVMNLLYPFLFWYAHRMSPVRTVNYMRVIAAPVTVAVLICLLAGGVRWFITR